MNKLMRRRRALMEESGSAEQWDYSWNESMGATPPNATYAETKIEDGKRFFRGLNLIFAAPSASGKNNAEIVIVADQISTPAGDSPQFGIKDNKGGKIYLTNQFATALAGMTASQTASVTNGWHEYRVVMENGVFTAFFDGQEIGSGNGRQNSYDKNGVTYASSQSAYVKSIKYREW